MHPLILDGGMGQELIRRAGRATPLWSIQALLDAPQWVSEVHDEYFNAGAQVATTNSYMLLPDRIEEHGLEGRLPSLTALSCELACRSRDRHGSGLVAGSLGPLGFSFRPDMCPPAEVAADIYANLAQMHAPWVDVHLLETMASVDQARGGLMGTAATGKPVWLAVTVCDEDGTRLRSGEALQDLAPLLDEYVPEALLVNCSMPEAIDQAMTILPRMWQRTGAYANGFTGIAPEFDNRQATVELLQARRDLDPDAYAAFAEGWVRQGIEIVGGCCEVGPAHIRELTHRILGGRIA